MNKKPFGTTGKEPFTAAAAAMILFAAALVLLGVYPFGKYTIVCSDMEQQFLDLTVGLFNNIKSGKNIFVTYSGGLGINLYAWGCYLLFSPFNILFLFFDAKYYQEVYTLIEILKFGMISFCTSVYFKKSRYANISGAFNIGFSLLYTFSAFSLVSVINVMWLDNIAMLPITLLGIERIIEDKKPAVLYFSFLYCLASNFYLAFITGLFAFLYYCYYIFTAGRKDFAKSLFTCALTVLLAAGTCAAVLIPVWLAVSGSYGEMFKSDALDSFIRWSPLEILRGFTLIRCSSANAKVLHIFFGVSPLLLTPVFLFSPDIPKKERIAAAAWLVFMVLGLLLRPLYYMWHLFREPTGFHGRFVYTAAFLCIVFSVRALKSARITVKRLAISAAAVLMLTAIAVCTEMSLHSLANLAAVFVFLAAYTYFPGAGSKKAAKIAVFAEAVILCGAGLYCFKQYNNFAQRSKYTESLKNISALAAETDDSGFYRATTVFPRSENSALSAGYNTTDCFSSLTNQKSLRLLSYLNMYCPRDYRYADNYYNSAVNESFFGIKYIYVSNGTEKQTDTAGREIYTKGGFSSAFRLTSEGYKKIKETENGTVYENTNAFPLMFACSENTAGIDSLDWVEMYQTGGCSSQEIFLNSLFDTDYVLYSGCGISRNGMSNAELRDNGDSTFTLVPLSNDAPAVLSYDFTAKKDGSYFTDTRAMYEPSDGYDLKYFTSINGIAAETKRSIAVSYEADDIGFYKAGDKITADIYTYRPLLIQEPVLLRLNTDSLNAFAQLAQQNALEQIKQDGSDITAHSNFDERRLVLSTLSYDKGFHVYIDGEETETLELADSLLGYYVPAGSHDIKIKYMSPGFKTSLAATVLFSVLSAIFLLAYNKINKTGR